MRSTPEDQNLLKYFSDENAIGVEPKSWLVAPSCRALAVSVVAQTNALNQSTHSVNSSSNISRAWQFGIILLELNKLWAGLSRLKLVDIGMSRWSRP